MSLRLSPRLFSVVTSVLLIAATGVEASPPPVAPLPTDRAAPPGYTGRLARFREAELKTRALVKSRRVTAAPTASMVAYDAVFYDLDMRLDPAARRLDGVVALHARVTAESLANVDLHLADNMIVTDVRADGGVVPFSHGGGILSAELPRSYLRDETVVVSVEYHGDPEGASFGWDTYQGSPLIWTLSEPFGARDWWPCKDLNTDKADSVVIRATVPDGLIVASNGVLESETAAAGWRTFVWRERYPIATYLVSLAIHSYATFSTWYTPLSGGDPMEIRNFVVPDKLAQSQVTYALTDEIMSCFANAFGEYPFLAEKYGHAHFPWGGAMEHQTCTSMTFLVFDTGIVAHELAHQWWGDLVTCSDFHHIWLQEGLATWSEAYWRECNEGAAAYHDEMADAVYWGEGTIYVEDTSDFAAIFDFELTYEKASWVVHMLRRALGDADFFAGLALFRARHGFGDATTADLRAVMEEVSGRDLGPFFDQWIYGEYYPVYRFSYSSAPFDDQYRVTLRVDQVQTNAGLFVMPLPVRVSTAVANYDFVVEDDALTKFFTLEVPGPVLAVDIDPDWSILRRREYDGEVNAPAPAAPLVRLDPAEPNPFNPGTTLRFDLPRVASVRLEIYDARGRRIRALIAGEQQSAGEHTLRWDGRDQQGRAVPTGVYVARLAAGNEVQSRKLTLLR